MSIENPFSAQEKAPDHFPSQEELKTVFEDILKGQEYKDLKIKKKEKKLFSMKLKFP